ncbi:hypothetical protein CBR_g57862 [Chara braunii]|uniref:Uncharacterized protein n=1 Tax=Chara braunii TaxID=69332 RepID=A0A388K871_CHABU|nr:hypothetical protein CBR_g57862 [Chara braunii]|eukprot:GBG66262.1 hypothetical protein CBR_g57862 [Chara braunii]
MSSTLISPVTKADPPDSISLGEGLHSETSCSFAAGLTAPIILIPGYPSMRQIGQATGKPPTAQKTRDPSKDLKKRPSFLDSPDILQKEIGLRKGQLEKISSLDDDIRKEIQTLTENMAKMKMDLERFSRAHEIKASAEVNCKQMEAQKVKAIKKREAFKIILKEKEDALKAKKANLRDSDLYIALEKLEQKMSSLEANIFQMQDYIDTKDRETDYKPIASEVSKLTADLNAEIQKVIAAH